MGFWTRAWVTSVISSRKSSGGDGKPAYPLRASSCISIEVSVDIVDRQLTPRHCLLAACLLSAPTLPFNVAIRSGRNGVRRRRSALRQIG